MSTSKKFLVHLWFRSYLCNRTQTVTINNKLSQPALLNFGVHQHFISNQSFADDTQLQDSCRPDQIDTSVQGMQDCISDVKTWMTSNKLKLNDDKTECLLIVSNRTSLPKPHPTTIHIGDTDILFSLQSNNLGVTLTNNLSMEKHVTNICRSAYIEIRRISNIRHYLTIDATKPSSVLLFCQNLTTVILFYQVLQNILTNSKRSTILQPDLSSKFASMNASNPPSETSLAIQPLQYNIAITL